MSAKVKCMLFPFKTCSFPPRAFAYTAHSSIAHKSEAGSLHGTSAVETLSKANVSLLCETSWIPQPERISSSSKLHVLCVHLTTSSKLKLTSLSEQDIYLKHLSLFSTAPSRVPCEFETSPQTFFNEGIFILKFELAWTEASLTLDTVQMHIEMLRCTLKYLLNSHLHGMRHVLDIWQSFKRQHFYENYSKID